ncbi:MAG TPA: hypothetical protein VHW45_10230 [Candidatus Sulfotelmatobacter sp.]|jgi:hypothetical protein|nr:hypothetical protein [Candidatus Sulfotelmatobacter sp.]
MRVSGNRDLVPRAWQILIITLAICGLSVSLATRTFRLQPTTDAVKVASSTSQPVRQHLDRDAVAWVPPVPILFALQGPTFYPRFAPAPPPLLSVLFDQSLANRPPPSC